MNELADPAEPLEEKQRCNVRLGNVRSHIYSGVYMNEDERKQALESMEYFKNCPVEFNL